MLDGWDDEQLLAALGEAMKPGPPCPAWFTEMGKNAMPGTTSMPSSHS